MGEGTTRRGTDTPVHRPAKPAGSTHNSTRGLRPPEQLERQAELPSSVRRGLTLLSQLCSDPAGGVRNGRKPEVPASARDEALFHCAKLSGVPRDALPTPQYPSPLRGTLGSSLRSQAEVEGNEGFPLQPEKDLKSPSSTRLEALVPSQDSRAMTRSSSRRAWRPDFPGTAQEAP